MLCEVLLTLEAFTQNEKGRQVLSEVSLLSVHQLNCSCVCVLFDVQVGACAFCKTVNLDSVVFILQQLGKSLIAVGIVGWFGAYIEKGSSGGQAAW